MMDIRDDRWQSNLISQPQRLTFLSEDLEVNIIRAYLECAGSFNNVYVRIISQSGGQVQTVKYVRDVTTDMRLNKQVEHKLRTHCAGWWACGCWYVTCRIGPRSTGCCSLSDGLLYVTPLAPAHLVPLSALHPCGGFLSLPMPDRTWNKSHRIYVP